MERFLGAVTTAAPAPGLQLLLGRWACSGQEESGCTRTSTDLLRPHPDTHDLRGRELLLQAVLGRLQGHPRQQRSRRSGSSAPPPQHDARTAAAGQQQPVVLVCSELAVAVDGPLAAVLAHPAASRLLHILDASSDPLGWDVAAPPSAPAAAGTSCAALAVTSLPALAAAATAAATPRGGPRPAVVFDSLTPWLRRHPLHSVCKVLRQIAQRSSLLALRFVCVVSHKDPSLLFSQTTTWARSWPLCTATSTRRMRLPHCCTWRHRRWSVAQPAHAWASLC